MDGQQQTTQDPDEPTWQFQPGQTVTPDSQAPSSSAQPTATEPAPALSAQTDTSQSPAFTAEPPRVDRPMTISQPAAPTAAQTILEPVAGGASPDVAATEPETPTTYWQGNPTDSISWTASEFIAHHKSFGWYALLNLGVVALAAIAWFVTKDLVASAVIVFAGIVLSLYGARQPRQLQYQLDDHGLTIQGRRYGYQGFRSFSVTMEGPFATIAFMPLKRFSPLLTLYCDPQDEDNILTILSRHLPHEARRPDAIDSLMRRIRL